ncbi:c-type cytochrome [Salinimonas lutimaris]|uniref:c-type cytochrome n=1 Tax=Salinimonas lutimaris TaxID=914153 RepID=UPI0010C016AE|nr:cytochrome c [Salinimonas lutimaris]
MTKPTMKVSLTLLVLVVLAVSGWAWSALNTSASDVANDVTPLKDVSITNSSLIERGEYVMRAADCAACHSREYGEFAGGYEMKTPFGTLVSSNISPDVQTGIGNMTERDFFNAVRQGIGSHGLQYPAMPFTAFRKISDEDMHALWAYWSTLEPVNHDVDENADMPFPFNIRLAMAGWDMLFFDNKGLKHNPEASGNINRGRYLVEGPGHCSTCHTPRNLLGAEKQDAFLHGGNIGKWYAPDITPAADTLVGQQQTAAIVRYLKSGTDGKAVAGGPMAEAVEHSLQYLSQEDLTAIAAFLKAQKPSHSNTSLNNTAPATAAVSSKQALVYEVNCAACHGVEGEGIRGIVPSFAGNTAMQADDPTNLIHVMLRGGRAAYTSTARTAAGMPSFAWKMNDQQIAEILNYVRNNWGNQASNVTTDQVKTMRKELNARQQLSTPQQAGD